MTIRVEQNSRKAELTRQLQADVSLLTFAIDNVLEAAYLSDENGQFLYVNEAACRGLGYCREELLCMSVPDIVPDFLPDVWDAHRQELARHGSLSFEERHRRKDGSIFPVCINVTRFEHNAAQYSLALVHDLTEPKRMEAELSQRERDFRSLAENLPDNIARWDAAGRYLYLNPTHERTLAVAAADVIGKTISEAFPDGRFTPVEMAIAQIVASGQEELNVRQAVPTGDGGMSIHDVSLVPERDTDGNIVSVLGIGRDMTDTYRLQDALAVREQEYRGLAENSPDAIIRYDCEGRIRYLNSRLVDDLGLANAEKVIGKLPSEAWPDGCYDEIERAVAQAIETGSAKTVELVEPMAVGEPRFSQIRIVAEWDASGQVVGAIAFGHDMTNIYRMQEALAAREQEFRALAEHSPDTIARYDRECRRTYANPTFAKQAGVAVEALLGITPTHHFPDQPQALAYEARLKEVLDSGIEGVYEFSWPARDGKLITNHIRIVPEWDREGKVASVLAIGRDISAIRTADQRLTQFVANFPGFAFTFSLSPEGHGSFPFASPGIEKLYGLKPEDVKDDMAPVHELAHPEDRPRIEAAIAESARTMTPFHVETRVCRPGLPERWIEVLSVPLTEADGSIVWHGLMIDIDERKHMEAELRSQADFQQTLLKALCDVGMQLMMIENGRIVHVGNRELAQQLGYTDAELDSQPPIADLIHPDDRAWVLDYYHHRLAGEAVPESYELGLVTRDGVRLEYETAVAIVPGTDPVRVITVGKDISERKHMEAAREESRNFLDNIVNAIVDPVFVKDRQHRWVLLNEAFCQFIGHSRDELLGKCDFDFFPESEAQVFWEKDEAVFTSSEENVNEEKFTDSDGINHTIVTKKSLYTDDTGQSFIVGIILDITERKAMETARETALAEAIRLAQARSAFLSQMSHELRTPLNGILGCAQLLQQYGETGEEQSAWVNAIEQSGVHLLSLVEDILDHAKLEADKQELNLGDIELGTLLDTVAGIIRVKAEEKHLTFHCEMAADVPGVIRGDEKRLRQVLLNLLANAVKFTAYGQVSLRVSCPASGRILFEVRDSGIGIDTEQLDAVFEPFEQVGDASRFASGTGLGLAISRKLVRLMGGDIKVESRIGEGSLFYFELEMEAVQSGQNASDALREQTAQPLSETIVLPPFVPPGDELKTLLDLAQRGNMRHIMQRATYLAELDERYLPFADRLRKMAKAYQSKTIVNFVEQSLEKNPGTEEPQRNDD